MLDTAKPFGRVRGAPGIAYEQAGNLYNAQKEPVDASGQPLKKSAPKKSAPKAKTEDRPAGVRPMSEQEEDNE
jgi:hypothetical protein